MAEQGNYSLVRYLTAESLTHLLFIMVGFQLCLANTVPCFWYDYLGYSYSPVRYLTTESLTHLLFIMVGFHLCLANTVPCFWYDYLGYSNVNG